MAHQQTIQQISSLGLIAVIRCSREADLINISDALIEGGITCVEITITTPGALQAISALAKRTGVCIGAGSVLNLADCRKVIDAGAQFYASPVLDTTTVDEMKRAGLVAIPGAYTPTEIHAAWNAGADFVKLFPMPPNGAGYIQSLLGPMPYLKLAPSGGITPVTAPGLLAAGAAILSAGTWLTHEPDGTPGLYTAIRGRTATLVQSVQNSR